jgi:hypothetical protein
MKAVNVAMALLRRGSLSKDGKRRCRGFPAWMRC